MDKELKPCPFCGSIPSINIYTSVVGCENEKCPIYGYTMLLGDWDKWNYTNMVSIDKAIEAFKYTLKRISYLESCDIHVENYADDFEEQLINNKNDTTNSQK